MVKFGTESKIPKRRNRIKLLLLFSFTFAATLFLLTTIIRNYSPPIDVNIGNEEIVSIELTDDIEDFDDFEEGEVDSRLKWIQYEDNNPGVNSIDNPIENVADINKTKEIKKKNTTPATYKRKHNIQNRVTSTEKLNRPKYITATNVSLAPSIAEPTDITKSTKVNTVNSKVYVGYYPTKKHAINALNYINAAVPGFNPYIKTMNEQYVIQVGSFTDKTKAMNLKHELLRKGFPAKLTIE
ncbi:MAG: SPOR domain-containing protein [Candidatus Gastranaerophilaceae bacterium]